MHTPIFGINISTKPKKKILEELQQRCANNQKTFIVTPYSEFFYHSFRDYDFKQVLNSADYALADGIGTLWLAYYFSIPLTVKNYYGKIVQAIWQVVYSGAQILLQPKKLYSQIPEKISGADFFWDLVKLANQNGLSIFLLGGYGDTPEKVAEKILQKYPGIKIAGFSNQSPNKITAEEINKSNPDILMVAYGPVKQEYWLSQHLPDLNVKIAIGLGGTFDYVAGKRIAPPNWVRKIGLEWLYRLITQPRRIKRIWHGTYGIMQGAVRQKVFASLPYRANVCSVIINSEGKIFVAKRNLHRDRTDADRGDSSLFPDAEEHWQFPQGGVDPGEDLEKAVLRECREETNMIALKVIGKSDKINYYSWNGALKRVWFTKKHYKFKGQAQYVYYLKYSGDGSEIKMEEDELTDYKWVKPEQLPTVIHAIRQNVVKIILEDINKYI